jgi:glucose-6-phosphate 1-epimerase
VDVRKHTDSVFDDTPGNYEISWPGGCIDIKTKALKNLVVWNPREELGRKIGDMEDDGW